MATLRPWLNEFATHQPVLVAAANACSGPIIEFGCGEGSTRLLHEIARRRSLPLLTLETDAAWMGRYQEELSSRLHEFRLVDDWTEELADPMWDQRRWGLAFIDQAPWEARANTARRLSATAEYLIIHDCDYLPEHGLLGRSIRPLVGPQDVGERSYDEEFSSWREFFPPEPWPLKATGPPTLLASNNRDVTSLDVDYTSGTPPRIIRALAQQASRVRQRLAARF
jgi:hypothetical protein